LKAKRSKKEEVVEKENKVQNSEVVDIRKVEKEGEGNAN
jgi:hypothetical protein